MKGFRHLLKLFKSSTFNALASITGGVIIKDAINTIEIFVKYFDKIITVFDENY